MEVPSGKIRITSHEWVPTEFMKLMIEYENDETKIKDIMTILNSDKKLDYLCLRDPIGFDSFGFCIKKNLKIKKVLFNSLSIEDGTDKKNILSQAIFYHDLYIVKLILNNFLDSMDLNDEEYSSSVFLIAFNAGNIEIIKCLLDLYEKYDIFTMYGIYIKSVYERIFTELIPECRDLVLEILMTHKHYGPILRNITIINFGILLRVSPCLIGSEKINLDKFYTDFYCKAKNIEDFRENCIHEIPDFSNELKYHPEHNSRKIAKYRREALQKFGTNDFIKMTEDQRKEYYEEISKDINLCEYYSIKTIDDLKRLEDPNL